MTFSHRDLIWVVMLVGSASIAYFAGWGCRLVGPKFGFMDTPDGDLKSHAVPVPYLGGIGIALAIFAEITIRDWVDWRIGLVVLGAFLVGLLDDRFSVPVSVRIVGEIVLAVLFATFAPAHALPWAIAGFAVAVILFVGIVNAVNMVDGLDGLAGTCALITCIGVSLIGTPGAARLLLLLATAGALVGFLAHNLPPARLFLGDNGAYLLGAVLAFAIIPRGSTPPLAGSITALGIFALDLGLSILRRVFGGRSPMHGDRQHFYDQLVARGRTGKQALILCVALQACFVIAGKGMSLLPDSELAVVVFAIAWTGVGIALAATGFIRPKEPAA